MFLLTLSPFSAYSADFQFRTQTGFLYDISVDNEDWYIIRLQGEAFYNPPAIYNTLKIIPFLETRYHFNLQKFSRTAAGVEIGTDLFKWLYWGESLQYASLHPGRDTIELESILKLHYPFKIGHQEVELYILNQHTFAFVIGEGKRNEFAAGFSWDLRDDVELLVSYRHTDRIHNYDSDQIGMSVIFKL